MSELAKQLVICGITSIRKALFIMNGPYVTSQTLQSLERNF